jgi:hypothetical protein
MAKINFTKENPLLKKATAVAFPVPARIRKKKEKAHLIFVEKSLAKYKLASEKYREISTNSKEFDNGEIYILRDVNLDGWDIQDPSVTPDEIIEIIDKESKLIVFLPTKTREDKEYSEYVYMSSLRALAQLLETNDEVREQFEVFSIPVFPSLLDNIEKLHKIFENVDIEILVCHGT